MISAFPDSTHFITVSVGQEIRVREGQKSSGGEVHKTSDKKNADQQNADQQVGQTLPESLSHEQIQEVLLGLQETLHHVQPKIELSFDQELNQIIFRIFDEESGELLRTIPPEDVIDLKRFFADQSGWFVEEKI